MIKEAFCMGQYIARKRKLGLVCQCIVLSLVLVFGQASAITGNQDNCEGITNNLSTNSQDQEIAFPFLPYSGNQTIYSPCSPVNDEQYYIKYSEFGYSCIEKQTGLEIPISITPYMVNFIRNKMAIIKDFGIISSPNLSWVMKMDEKRFCAITKGKAREYLIMFDQDGIKWEFGTNSGDYSLFPKFYTPLGPKKIFFDSKIIDAETGKVLLELKLDNKHKLYRTSDIILHNNFALISKLIVIDIEKSKVLWTIPEDVQNDAMIDFHKNNLIVLNTKNFTVTYYNAQSGNAVKRFEFKPNLKQGESVGQIIDIVGKLAYFQNGYVIDIESGDIIIENKHSMTKNRKISQYFVRGDNKNIIWEDIAGIECLDTKTGKVLWRKEESSYVSYREFEGRLYKNAIHLADNPTSGYTYDESLSVLENGSWRELARMPFRGFSYLYTTSASLIPTRHGVLWLPFFQKDFKGPSIIAPGTSTILKSYILEGWGRTSGEYAPGYALVDNTLIANLDGLGIYLIDLESGKSEYIQIPDTTRNDNVSFGPVPVIANKKYAVTQDVKGIAVFDIEKKVFLRRLGPFEDNMDVCLDYSVNQFFFEEWFSLDCYIINLETGKIIENRRDIVGITDKGYLTEDDGVSLLIPGEKPKNLISSTRFYDIEANPYVRIWKTLSNYGISGNVIIDIDRKIIIQKMLQYYYGILPKITFSNGEIIFADLGKTLKFSPCPSFSVKRNGKTTSGDNEVSFEFRNTREDGRDLVLKGEVYLVSWGDDGKAPLFAKLNEPKHKLGPLLPGMSQEITFKLPEPPLLENNQKGEGKYFALVVESNGLMDRDKSVLSEYDKDPRPLFDGTPVALDQQKAIVVTVWGR